MCFGMGADGTTVCFFLGLAKSTLIVLSFKIVELRLSSAERASSSEPMVTNASPLFLLELYIESSTSTTEPCFSKSARMSSAVQSHGMFCAMSRVLGPTGSSASGAGGAGAGATEALAAQAAKAARLPEWAAVALMKEMRPW